MQFDKYFPILDWGRRYNRQCLSSDLSAAVIVTIMLIPQSLAYALLAGLPPEAGIYASIVPVLLYSVFGSSSALAVGPVAIVSLLTASALADVAAQGTAGYAVAALTLALLSGCFLLALGLLRLGSLANFLSHPVIAGFITASGILIATSQLKHLLGIEAQGHTLPELISSVTAQIHQSNGWTLLIGIAATAFLFWVRKGLKPQLVRLGLSSRSADFASKVGPVAAVVLSILAVSGLGLAAQGVAVVGSVPQGLPPFTLPDFSVELMRQLAVPAILISVIGFVESVSIAQTLAAKTRQRIDPNQELIGLGAANIGAAFSGGYPVTGGFARSVVNYEAGAATPAAGAFTALGLAIAAYAFTPLLYSLPKATLAATIIVAVLSLVDFSILRKTWHYSRSDFLAVATTLALTLVLGVETGVATGVFLSIALHLQKTSRPHVAELGLVPGTQHFRNIDRHSVATDQCLLILRVDESLYFINARFLEDLIQDRVIDGPIRDVVLMFSAVNDVDYSALESLLAINSKLRDQDIGFHLSEVKGPIMDRLQKSVLLDELNGQVFLCQYDAWQALQRG